MVIPGDRLQTDCNFNHNNYLHHTYHTWPWPVSLSWSSPPHWLTHLLLNHQVIHRSAVKRPSMPVMRHVLSFWTSGQHHWSHVIQTLAGGLQCQQRWIQPTASDTNGHFASLWIKQVIQSTHRNISKYKRY